MAAEAKRYEGTNYNQELVQVMKEHELIEPDEEEQITTYLFITQWYWGKKDLWNGKSMLVR